MYSILFQNNDFLVINKAAGIGFHDEDGVDGICSIVRKDIGRLVFPVHRLDKVTSGLLLLAKSGAISWYLNEYLDMPAKRINTPYSDVHTGHICICWVLIKVNLFKHS